MKQIRQWIQNHMRGFYLVAVLLLIGFVIGGLGRLTFHNEIEWDTKPDVYLGCVDDQVYHGTVTITADQMPAWCQALGIQGSETVIFADGHSGPIGIFADLVYYENRYEVRTWLSGRTIKRESEYYWKINGDIQLVPMATEREPDIDVQQIKAADYDYTAFTGTE